MTAVSSPGNPLLPVRCLHVVRAVRHVLRKTKGLVTNYREVGYKTGGGQVKFYPYEKEGGGAEKVLAMMKGGGGG